MLSIVPLILGPAATNAYLIAEAESGEAAVIDPAWNGDLILAEAKKRGWHIGQLWITHAHFDHIGGAGDLVAGWIPPPSSPCTHPTGSCGIPRVVQPISAIPWLLPLRPASTWPTA